MASKPHELETAELAVMPPEGNLNQPASIDALCPLFGFGCLALGAVIN